MHLTLEEKREVDITKEKGGTKQKLSLRKMKENSFPVFVYYLLSFFFNLFFPPQYPK